MRRRRRGEEEKRRRTALIKSNLVRGVVRRYWGHLREKPQMQHVSPFFLQGKKS